MLIEQLAGWDRCTAYGRIGFRNMASATAVLLEHAMSDLPFRRLGGYDFGTALSLSVEDRLSVCVQQVREMHRESGYAGLCDLPPIPPAGASATELAELERVLGVPLPGEYRAFLARWRYLDVGTGLAIWGLDHEGVWIGQPWVSAEHPARGRYLVFGDYWRLGDGDQLMFQLDVPDMPVVVYLHGERPPAVEFFAPSFSLALWRLIHEAAPSGRCPGPPE
jgi:hypothetical protein